MSALRTKVLNRKRTCRFKSTDPPPLQKYPGTFGFLQMHCVTTHYFHEYDSLQNSPCSGLGNCITSAATGLLLCIWKLHFKGSKLICLRFSLLELPFCSCILIFLYVSLHLAGKKGVLLTENDINFIIYCGHKYPHYFESFTILYVKHPSRLGIFILFTVVRIF